VVLNLTTICADYLDNVEFSAFHNPVGLYGLFTGIVLLQYKYIMLVLHRKHAYGPPESVTEIALLFICKLCSYLAGNTPVELDGLLRVYLYFLTFIFQLVSIFVLQIKIVMTFHYN
jgi:hypothetical protein